MNTTDKWLDDRFAAAAATGDAANVILNLRARWVEAAEDALAQWDEARDASPDDEAAYDLLIAHQSIARLRDQADLTPLRDALAQRITRDATTLQAALRMPQPNLWLEEAAALCDLSSDDPTDWDDALIEAAWRSWRELDEALLAAAALHRLDVDPDALDALEDALADCVAFAQGKAWAWMPAEGPIRASASAISPPGAEYMLGFAWTQLYLNQLDAIDAWEAMEGLVRT